MDASFSGATILLLKVIFKDDRAMMRKLNGQLTKIIHRCNEADMMEAKDETEDSLRRPGNVEPSS